jgi:DNA polymerase-1
LANSEIGKIGHIILIESLQSWDQALKEIEACRICGVGIKTKGPDPLTQRIQLIQVALPDNRVYIADLPGLGERERILGGLAKLLEDNEVRKVIYNANFELSFIRASQMRRLKPKNIFDILLASQLCWSGYYDLAPSKSKKNPWRKRVPDHSLEALAERHLDIILERSCQDLDWSISDHSPEQIEKEMDYSAERVRVLLPLHIIFQELIKKNRLEKVAELEFRTISPVVEMELSGICFDSKAAKALISEKESQLVEVFINLQAEAKANDFHTLSNESKMPCDYFNPESREDIIRYLQSQGFSIASTRADVLKELAGYGYIFAEELLRYRQVSHELVFLDNWLKKTHSADGRIHSTYYQLKSATGRLCSCRPNAQQIPSRGDDATVIRKLFKAAPGKKFVKADFSAIELRIMAYLSGDETMQSALQEGQDLHKLTASRVSGLPLEQVTREQRQAAKTINFLLIYGGSAQTLQWRALSDYGNFMSLDEAEEARNKFFATYPGIKQWQEKQIAEMSFTVRHYFHNCIYGTFEMPLTCTFTALGRRRVWPRFGAGIRASKFQLFNTPCQGTGADLIKLVMCELYDKLQSEDARIVGSIHDEIVLEVPEDEAEYYASLLCEVMNRVGSEMLYPVPVTSSVEISSSW